MIGQQKVKKNTRRLSTLDLILINRDDSVDEVEVMRTLGLGEGELRSQIPLNNANRDQGISLKTIIAEKGKSTGTQNIHKIFHSS